MKSDVLQRSALQRECAPQQRVKPENSCMPHHIKSIRKKESGRRLRIRLAESNDQLLQLSMQTCDAVKT